MIRKALHPADPEFISDVEPVTSESVTNAIRYARIQEPPPCGVPVGIWMEIQELLRWAHLRVRDPYPAALPTKQKAEVTDTAGRGLAISETVATLLWVEGKRWEPARLTDVVSIFSTMPCPWWVAGGYAIELAVGRPIRDHGDIDVMVLRRDQPHVQRALRGWEWWAVDPPGVLRPWNRGEELPVGIHDIWCRPAPDVPWRIQVMLDESCDDEWVSRRDPGIRRPLAGIGRIGGDGVRYLAPEIQLFYKAKRPRPKDEVDFAAVLPVLTEAQRRWLDDALARAFGEHPWRDRLAELDYT